MPDGLVVGRSRISHELHPDDLGGLVHPEGDWRKRPEKVLRRKEDHQLPVGHGPALAAEQLVAVLVRLDRLALDVLAAVVGLNLKHNGSDSRKLLGRILRVLTRCEPIYVQIRRT